MPIRNTSLLVRGLSCFLGLAAIAAAAGDPTPGPSDRALPSTAISDHYIVELAAGADAGAVAGTHGAAANFIFENAVHGFAGFVPPGRLVSLREDPRVLRVIPDRQVTAIATTKAATGGTTVSTQVVPAGVKRIGATPGSVTYTGNGVGVAVLDTGVDLKHGDLKPLGTASFSAFGGTAQDLNGHGTHVAGIIAARNNTIDVVGVAPAATIYAVRVLDASGNGSDSAVIAGLDWVAKNAALVSPRIRVVNMSLGRAGNATDNPVMRASITTLRNAGIAVIVAAGNDATLEISQQVPAAYPEVMAVASTSALPGTNQYKLFSGVIGADTASHFTSDGTGVAVSAPGEDQENIDSAGTISSVGILSTKLGGGTIRLAGTSMAAPHVAGVAALIFQKNPALGAQDIRDRISVGALGQTIAPLNSPTSSYTFDGVREGVLNVAGALVAP